MACTGEEDADNGLSDAKEVVRGPIEKNLGDKNRDSKLRNLTFILKPLENH